jgi:hypothetical protein
VREHEVVADQLERRAQRVAVEIRALDQVRGVDDDVQVPRASLVEEPAPRGARIDDVAVLGLVG